MIPYFDLANIVMVFLLSVVGVAVWLGRGPAVLAAFVNVAAFDFFFVPPRLSFAVADVQYLLTFAVMLIVGLVTGQLTAGLRFQARAATHREARSRALFEAARDLSNMLTIEQAVEVASQGGRTRVPRARGGVLCAGHAATAAAAARRGGLAADTERAGPGHRAVGAGPQPAARPGSGTDTLPGSAWLYLPLKATDAHARRARRAARASRASCFAEQRQQLETFAALTAMALERVHYIDVARNATVQMESERLRNSLLSALSHDLRTPLSALVGLADTLATSQPALSPAQAGLVAAINERTQRMTDMVTNLLDMARIQSGAIRVRMEWQSLEEIVGAAIKSSQPALGVREVTVRIDPEVPLVECDAVLIERVLANLLENAGKFTPPLSPVAIRVHRVGSEVQLSVRDHGPGRAQGPGREHLREVHPRRARIRHARRRPGTGHLPRHRRGAPRSHLGRSGQRRRRHLQLHPASGHPAGNRRGRRRCRASR